MTALAVLLALGAALLHAAWNVRLKSSADPLRLSAVALPLGTALVTPVVVLAWLASGRPGLPWQGWALAALSGLVELAYFHALSGAYRRGDISSTYPVARGTAPVLAAAVGLLALRERLTPVQGLGVAVLICGVWLARPAVSRGAGRSLLPAGAALPLALLTGVLIAVYTTVDRLGVRTGPFWLYTWAVFAASSLFLLPWARTGLVGGAWPVGLLAIGSYGLVLTALSIAPLAVVAPLRESGVIIVALWGVFRLGERRAMPMKLGGAAAVAAGAALVALG